MDGTWGLGGAALGAVTLDAEADRSRIVLRGEVDANLNSEMARVFTEVARRGLPADVDTRATTFVDSTVVAAIAHLARKLPAGVTVVDPTEQVRFLLQISEVEQVVTITDTAIIAADDVPDLAAEVVEGLRTPPVPELPGEVVADAAC